MSYLNLTRLILLGAIWGASFLFMRIAVPSFGPPVLIELRLLMAALLLAVVASVTGRRLDWGRHWRHYSIIGAANSAIPFLLFAYAAKTLPASLLSLFNSLAPIFGAIVAALWFRTSVSRSAAIGLGSGVLGVAVLTSDHLMHATVAGNRVVVALSFGAATLAPVCYAVAGAYIKWKASDSDAFSNAHGSMWASSALALPLALMFMPSAPPSGIDWFAAAALGVICTGVAYLLYFKLIAELGPMRTLSVSFLIPVFGVLWGAVLLDEPVGWTLLVGGALILLGTALATGILRPSGTSDASKAVAQRSAEK